MNKKYIIAIFDFDGTIINFQSANRFVDFCNKKRKFSILKYISYFSIKILLRFLKKINLVDKYKRKLIHLYSLRGIKKNEMNQLSKIFVREFLLPKENKNIIDKIEYHRRENHTIILLSASYQPYLQIYGGLRKFDYVIGNELKFKDEYFTGRLKDKDNLEIEKVKNLKKNIDLKNIDLKQSFGYSDDLSDLPFIKLVGKKYMVKNGKVFKWQNLSEK